MHAKITESRGLRILALDGGDAWCMAEMHILNEFMYRVERRTGKGVRPRDYFDLIVGVDSAGFLAALLVTFGMTVLEAQDTFFQTYTTVFANHRSSATHRSKLLETSIKGLMDKKCISESTKLSDVDLGGTCKLAICYASSMHLGHNKMFRNYQSHLQVAYEPTVLEAILATWATPNLMAPIRVGPSGRQEELVSSVGFNNPTQEAITEAYNIFGGDSKISCILSLGSSRRNTFSLVKEKSSPLRVVDTQAAIQSDSLAEEIQRRIGRLNTYYRFSVDNRPENGEPFCGDFGVIMSCSAAYLSRDLISCRLDDCLKAAEKASAITMEHIYRPRLSNVGSSHGLPPLSAFFVERKVPLEAMREALLGEPEPGQRVMVLSGLAGSGKTQLVLKFARDHEDRFKHILFVDASSRESLENGLITRLRSIGVEYCRKSAEEVMDVLAHPDEVISTNWLIILDNADDPTLDISRYLPTSDHGSVIVTTRNAMLGDLAPSSHLRIEVMSSEEAVEALLSSAFSPHYIPYNTGNPGKSQRFSSPNARDRAAAAAIVETLGCLPIAVVQAGCYIRQQHCLHQYVDRLRKNRAKILGRATQVHRDHLKYEHSIYAALNVTLDVLSSRARHLLGILSFGHFSNFPRPVFGIGASNKFTLDSFDLLDRPPDFHVASQFLMSVFCPAGVWADEELDDILEELQRYSLVTLDSIHSTVILRFHPLAHAWARDQLSPQEHESHRSAFIRLLTCSMTWRNSHLFEYLSPHINALLANCNALHVNDRAAFSQVLQSEGKVVACLNSWKDIYEQVVEAHGKMHYRASCAALELADAYGNNGETETMERLEREAIATRETLLGKGHVASATARSHLARTLRGQKFYRDAEILEKDILRIRIQELGLWNHDTADGMIELGVTLAAMSRYGDAEALLAGAVEIRAHALGRSDVQTIQALELLAQCYHMRGCHDQAQVIQKEVLHYRQLAFGDNHLMTVTAMGRLAGRYYSQGRYEDAEVLRREELCARKRLQGDEHVDTLETMHHLALACYQQGRSVESGEIWRQTLNSMMSELGRTHKKTLNVINWLAQTCSDEGRYHDAAALWTELLKGLRETPETSSQAEVMNALNCLAEAYRDLGLHADAETTRLQEIEGRIALEGPKALDTLNSKHWLGRAYFAQGYYPQAEQIWKEELEARREVHGNQHLRTLVALHWLAQACLELKLYASAENLWREDLENKRMVWGNNEETTLNTIGWLAEVCHEQGNYREAQSLRQEEMEGWKWLFGTQHPRTLTSMNWLGRALLEQGQPAAAEVLFEEELQSRRDLGHNRHLTTLMAIHCLARANFEQDRYPDAEKLWKEELAIRKEVEGDRHAHTAHVLSKIARLYDITGRYDEAKEAVEQALSILREIAYCDDPFLLENEELLESISFSIAVNSPLDGFVMLSGESHDPDQVMDGPAPDPGGDPSVDSLSRDPLAPIPRPTSPFNQRTLFGRRPNQWSMFF